MRTMKAVEASERVADRLKALRAGRARQPTPRVTEQSPAASPVAMRVSNASIWSPVGLVLMMFSYLLLDASGLANLRSSIDVWALKSSKLAMVLDQVSSGPPSTINERLIGARDTIRR